MISEEAEQLNGEIRAANPAVFAMLSKKGREIYFPKKGIINQSKEAAGKKINATIGVALDDNGAPLHFSEISKLVRLPASEIYNYAPGYGVQKLREAWTAEMKEKNPNLAEKTVSLPLPTVGLTQALSVAGYLFADEGDKIITPDLYWENYNLIFENAYSAALDTFPLFNKTAPSSICGRPTCPTAGRRPQNHFQHFLGAGRPEIGFSANGFNLNGLREKLEKPGKKIVLLNFPNNPTGYTPTKEEAHSIVQIISDAAKRSKIVTIVDDAYFGLNFEEGLIEESVFSQLCDLHENVLAVKIDGATKEEFVWGLRVGFITFGAKGLNNAALSSLADKAAGVVRGHVSNVSHLSQNLILRALLAKSRKREKSEHVHLLKQRYEIAKEVLAKHPEYAKYFVPFPFNSGYFMCVKILPPNDAEKVRQELLVKHGVGVVAFSDMLRIAFSSVPDQSIKELFAALYDVCGSMNA